MSYQITSLLNKRDLVYVVDRMVDDAIKQYIDEEERASQLLASAADLCYSQGMIAVKHERITNPTDEQLINNMYHCICAATQRWIVVRDYLANARSIEIHPTWMMMFIRGLYNENSQARLDRCMAAAYTKYINANEEELEQLFCQHEVISDDPDESLMNDPELLRKFFEAFRDLKTVHRNRDKYTTDEDKQKHDYLMSVYQALRATGLKVPEEDNTNV